jgi:hypothetical protein
VMIVSDTTYAITLPSVDGVKDAKYPIPQTYALTQNYPNPFNPTTAIEYDIPKTGNVSIKVYNLLGSEVATIVSGVKQPGHYLATWNAEQFASGVYFYRLSTPSFTSVKKMLLLR